MASSNIKLFDENKGNMLTDTEFNISTQRLNGLQTGVASSQLQNKAMYQASLVAYAIAQIMLQNGLNANDTDAVSAFVANLSGAILQKVYDNATTAEAQDGAATGKWMSPALTKAFFDYRKATTAEAQAGTNDTKWMSPALVKTAIDTLAAKAQNILSDATKALYGLSSSAVPNDVFSVLSDCFAQIRVITNPNVTVTASLNGKTVSATADSSGLAVLKILGFGTWTVTAGSASKTINIDAIAVFYMVIPNLESLSWSQVAYISKLGQASTLFHIGDKKTLTVNGVSYTAVIIGFDHDTPVDIATYGRDKAGITWQLENCLATTYPMNSSATNSGGWTSCVMRTSTMATLLNQLTSDLKNSIVKVKKLSSAGDKSTVINTTEDSLFLLSEVEIFGSISRSIAGEGSQYEYYASGNSCLKTVPGSSPIWWERSPYKENNYEFCTAYNTTPNNYDANLSFGVAFGFCV